VREYRQRGVHVRLKKNGKPHGLYDAEGKRVVNYEKRAENMKFCGSDLSFAVVSEKLKLVKANFCRVPLCPMCQWRKSMRMYFEVSKIMQVMEARRTTVHLTPVFLTLTVKNCKPADLGATLDNMFDAWNELLRSGEMNPKIKGKKTAIMKGWFRALEVTYNSKTDELHPHFHAIGFVERAYFKGKYYKSTEDWVKLWRRFAKLDYDPICDIRRTRTGIGKRNEVAEVAKYTYKDAEILNEKLTDEKREDVVKYLSSAFHGRRLYAYGGVMKSIAAELKFGDIDKADLVNVDDEPQINSELAKMIVKYHWNMGISNYSKRKKS
jgi:plasmid rolling circle replication initiator protein Rep